MVYQKSREKSSSGAALSGRRSPLPRQAMSRPAETTGGEITYSTGVGRQGDQSSVSIKLELQRPWKRRDCAHFTDVIREAGLPAHDGPSSTSAVNGVDAERRSSPVPLAQRVGAKRRGRRESLLTLLNFCGYRSVGLAQAETNCLLAGLWIHGGNGHFV